MNKNFGLLSIGAALLFSLFIVDLGHAFQIEKKQDARTLMAGAMNGTANPAATQVSNTPIPCGGRTAATCRTQGRQGSEATATAGSLNTSQVSNTPIPCGGRSGAPCTGYSPPGSREKASDGSLITSTTMLP